jgi:hypothetical protein
MYAFIILTNRNNMKNSQLLNLIGAAFFISGGFHGDIGMAISFFWGAMFIWEARNYAKAGN